MLSFVSRFRGASIIYALHQPGPIAGKLPGPVWLAGYITVVLSRTITATLRVIIATFGPEY